MSISPTGLEGVASEVAVICVSFGFEYCRMSFARLADASIASFVGWVSGSFSGSENRVTQEADLFDSGSE